MDTFDLKWPRTDATLYTDGWRCRIVWRERRGNLGGTIDNNEQCKRRVADSLDGAPDLLGALRARGHGLLASEIEALTLPSRRAPARVARRSGHTSRDPEPTADRMSAQGATVAQIREWIQRLEGDASWEEVDARRASRWVSCGMLGDETLLLKAPAPKGRQEWVLKRAWPKAQRRRAEYVAAPALRGICEYLHGRDAFLDSTGVERFLAGAGALEHTALADAARVWRRVSGTAH